VPPEEPEEEELAVPLEEPEELEVPLELELLEPEAPELEAVESSPPPSVPPAPGLEEDEQPVPITKASRMPAPPSEAILATCMISHLPVKKDPAILPPQR
jgi:hypothetical protein